MDRKFLVTMHTNCHFQLISVVKIKKNVAVDKKSSFIFCTRFGAQNAGNGISELPDFKIFWGSMPPDPPRLRGLVEPWLYSRLFFPNQLPTSNFIETPVYYIGREIEKIILSVWWMTHSISFRQEPVMTPVQFV